MRSAESNSDRLAAVKIVLERGHGKPRQEITGADGRDLIQESAASPDRLAQALLVVLGAERRRQDEAAAGSVH